MKLSQGTIRYRDILGDGSWLPVTRINNALSKTLVDCYFVRGQVEWAHDAHATIMKICVILSPRPEVGIQSNLNLSRRPVAETTF